MQPKAGSFHFVYDICQTIRLNYGRYVSMRNEFYNKQIIHPKIESSKLVHTDGSSQI